jgi:hypothetical protein
MYENDSHLTDMLAVVAQNWVSEFRDSWGLDAIAAPSGMEPLDWEFAKVCDQIAAQIISASRTLESDRSNLSERLDLLKDKLGLDLENDTLFTQLLEAHLVDVLEDELSRMRLRSLKLVRYLVDIKSENVRSYLARVGACFLRGLKIETVVMCGAVVDAALQEALDDIDIRSSGIKCGRYVSFGNRIEFMKQSGRWDSDVAEIAFKLAKERNDAIHTSPTLARSVDEVLKDVVLILGKIF